MYKSLNNNSIKTLEAPFSIGLIAVSNDTTTPAENTKNRVINNMGARVIVYTNNSSKLTIKAPTSTVSSGSWCFNVKAITRDNETVDLDDVSLNETKTYSVSNYYFVGFDIKNGGTGIQGKVEVTVE